MELRCLMYVKNSIVNIHEYINNQNIYMSVLVLSQVKERLEQL